MDMPENNDKTILARSIYHQYQGGEIYENLFASRVQEKLNRYFETADKDPLKLGNVFIEFHDSKDIRVKVDPNVRGRHVYYFHEFRGYDGEYDPNVGYMALFGVLDALDGVGRADKVTLVLPHIPYLRGDWPPESRVSIPAKMYASLTEQASMGKLHHLMTFDFHAPQEVAFFDQIRPDNIPFGVVVAEEKFKNIDGEIASVAMDSGGAGRARKFSKHLAKLKGGGYIPVILVDKYKPNDKEAEVHHIVGDPSGKICVANEDIIDSGKTAIAGATALLEKGAKDVYVCASDGLFSKKYDPDSGELFEPIPKMRASGAKIVIGDTLPRSPEFLEKTKDFIEVISVCPRTAEAIFEIETLGSVSKFYY